jgi:hypothetical protein
MFQVCPLRKLSEARILTGSQKADSIISFFLFKNVNRNRHLQKNINSTELSIPTLVGAVSVLNSRVSGQALTGSRRPAIAGLFFDFISCLYPYQLLINILRENHH